MNKENKQLSTSFIQDLFFKNVPTILCFLSKCYTCFLEQLFLFYFKVDLLQNSKIIILLFYYFILTFFLFSVINPYSFQNSTKDQQVNTLLRYLEYNYVIIIT